MRLLIISFLLLKQYSAFFFSLGSWALTTTCGCEMFDASSWGSFVAGNLTIVLKSLLAFGAHILLCIKLIGIGFARVIGIFLLDLLPITRAECQPPEDDGWGPPSAAHFLPSRSWESKVVIEDDEPVRWAPQDWWKPKKKVHNPKDDSGDYDIFEGHIDFCGEVWNSLYQQISLMAFEKRQIKGCHIDLDYINQTNLGPQDKKELLSEVNERLSSSRHSLESAQNGLNLDIVEILLVLKAYYTDIE